MSQLHQDIPTILNELKQLIEYAENDLKNRNEEIVRVSRVDITSELGHRLGSSGRVFLKFGTIESCGDCFGNSLLIETEDMFYNPSRRFKILSDNLSFRDKLVVAMAIPQLLSIVQNAESAATKSQE